MAFHDIPQRSPAWHALRAKNVGGSEVAILANAAPNYAMSPFAFWHVKAGLAEPPPVEGERIEIGMAMEPVIGALAAKRRGWTVTPGRYATDDLCPGLASSMDYEIAAPGLLDEGCEGPGYLECKQTDWKVWKRTYTHGEPPIYHLLQHQHGLAASGYGWGAIATLVGGNELHIRHYKARPKLIGHLRDLVTQFWQSVREGRVPQADGHDSTGHVLRQLFPDTTFEVADLTASNVLPGLCAEYQDAVKDEKEAKDRREELRNRILAEVGAHEHAETQGFFVAAPMTKGSVPRLAPPGYVIPGRQGSRRLTVSERNQAA